MSGVVLRCPQCGTTRTAPGECEACHEAQARYQCTNHTPGRWLDGRTCPDCKAQFGEPARPPAAARPPSPGRGPSAGRPVPAAPPPPRAKAPLPRRPAPGDVLPRRRGTLPPEVVDADPEDRRAAPVDPRGMVLDRWREMVAAAAAARPRRPSAGMDSRREPEAGGGLRMGGCLVRLVLFGLFAVFALLSALGLISGSVLQLLGVW